VTRFSDQSYAKLYNSVGFMCRDMPLWLYVPKYAAFMASCTQVFAKFFVFLPACLIPDRQIKMNLFECLRYISASALV
jgi:hypothetical protein